MKLSVMISYSDPQEISATYSPAAISQMNLSPMTLILLLGLFYILLGCPLDGVSMMVMTVPIVLPLVVAAGFDPVWFGVFLVVMAELGQISPPVNRRTSSENTICGDGRM